DVGDAVAVATVEVRRLRLEGHEAAVWADRGRAGAPVRLAGAAAHAHPARRARDEVADEDVLDAVGVAGDEVRGGRGEDDVAPVGGDVRLVGVAVGLAPVVGDADADDLPGALA